MKQSTSLFGSTAPSVIRVFAATLAITFLPALASAQTQIAISPGWARALPPGPDVRVKITEEYAKLVAREAYFWAWPMVNIYNRRVAFSHTKEIALSGPAPVAPPNISACSRTMSRPMSAWWHARIRMSFMAQARLRSIFHLWWSRCLTSAIASGSIKL